MNEHRFDQFTRVLTSTVPRRGVLKALVGGAFGAAVAAVRSTPALAACNPGDKACLRTNGQVQCCPSFGACCATRFGDEFCYDPATRYCSDGCGPMPHGSTCCIGANNDATSCPPDWFCCPLDTGSQNCCAPGQVCDPTFTCRAACPTGRVQCGKSCCREGEVCDADAITCRAGCPSGTECGEACCNPLLGEECCNGACVATDCEGGQVFNPASCACECPAGTTLCDGACVDTRSHPQHCGQCGNSCSACGICFDGRCDDLCPACQVCDRSTGACQPRPQGSTDPDCAGFCDFGRCCPSGQACVQDGAFLGCCPEGQRCIGGRCVKDPDYCNRLPEGPERAQCHRETSVPPDA